jgi:hypothetical protein
MIMRALVLAKAIRLVTCLALAASGSVACADSLQSNDREWQSFENQMMVDEYNQSFRENRRQLRSNFRAAAEDAFGSVGIPEPAVGYMGAAIGLAIRDSRFHLNDSKTLSLELMDLTQDNRGVFFGYRKRW